MDDIDALAGFVYGKVEPPPQWGEAEIAASRVEHAMPPAACPASPSSRPIR